MRRALALLLALGLLGVAPAAHAEAPTPADCPVEGARLDWGFKESFRAYIDGTIANGEWTVSDGASYDTPTFTWHDGTGAVGQNHLRGEISFVGTVRFTGHGSILDTTVANPVIRFDRPGRAMLLLDVSGDTMSGDPYSQTAVPFVELDLTDIGVLSRSGDQIIVDAAPATLTAEGSAAFPNYEAGSEFDAVDLTFTVGTDCEIELTDGVIGDATPFVVVAAALVGALVAAVTVLVVVRVRRRR